MMGIFLTVMDARIFVCLKKDGYAKAQDKINQINAMKYVVIVDVSSNLVMMGIF